MASRQKSKPTSRKTHKKQCPRSTKLVSLSPGQTPAEWRELALRNVKALQAQSADRPDRESRHKFLAEYHPQLLANLPYFSFSKSLPMDDEILAATAAATLTFQERMRPTDALEELAFSQALIAHARAAWLAHVVTKQSDAKSLAIVSEAADRAAGTFTRLMRAIREHRKPANSTTSLQIAQANVAGQQIVQNIQAREDSKNHGEQTGIHGNRATAPKVISAIEQGPAVAPSRDSANTALVEKHGTDNTVGEIPCRDERVQARSKIGRRRRAAKINSCDD
jgi:hypothetical protein